MVAELIPSSEPANVALVLSALAGSSPPAAAYCALVSPVRPTELADVSEAPPRLAATLGYAYLSAEEVIAAFLSVHADDSGNQPLPTVKRGPSHWHSRRPAGRGLLHVTNLLTADR